MDLTKQIDELADPAAYPFPCGGVEVRQTHISVVFLAGGFAYKVKKPVSLSFLDFSTLEKRRHFCDEEVRLNRRLAPTVYLGVVPVTERGGKLRFEGDGEPVEWAVKMVRLPADATLEARLERDEIRADDLMKLARRIADFHAKADGSPEVAQFGRFDVVARNAAENFEQSRADIDGTVHPDVHERLRVLSAEALERLRPMIEARAARGVPRDTHGDLRLDHVYLFPDRPPPEDVQVIDCIEFSDRFRYADPVADVAFLVMDLKFRGRPDLARAFAEAYFKAAGDEEGRALLPFYTAYRAIVRAKVEGIELREREIDLAEREAALDRAKAHWLLALGELEAPGRQPCLLVVGGLPGSGKSTLARGLAESANFTVIRSDVVRKEIIPARASDLYSAGQVESVYEECLRRAAEGLVAGQRVIIDATFREEKWRSAAAWVARQLAVPFVGLICCSDFETTRTRLGMRVGDASDADFNVYQQLARSWEPPGPDTAPFFREIDTNGPPNLALARANHRLRSADLT